jgi:hypothetical protein
MTFWHVIQCDKCNDYNNMLDDDGDDDEWENLYGIERAKPKMWMWVTYSLF